MSEEHQHTHSVYTLCHECNTWGVGMPGDPVCGNCHSTDTTLYRPPCCFDREKRRADTAFAELAELTKTADQQLKQIQELKALAGELVRTLEPLSNFVGYLPKESERLAGLMVEGMKVIAKAREKGL